MAKRIKDDSNAEELAAEAAETAEARKKPTVKDNLSELIAKNLGKQFKDSTDKVVWFLNSPDQSPTDVTDWVSTGSSILDIAISDLDTTQNSWSN